MSSMGIFAVYPENEIHDKLALIVTIVLNRFNKPYPTS